MNQRVSQLFEKYLHQIFGVTAQVVFANHEDSYREKAKEKADLAKKELEEADLAQKKAVANASCTAGRKRSRRNKQRLWRQFVSRRKGRMEAQGKRRTHGWKPNSRESDS